MQNGRHKQLGEATFKSASYKKNRTAVVL